MTGEEHNKYVWWGFLAHGLFQVLMLLFVLIGFIAFAAYGLPPDADAPPLAFFAIIFGFAAIVNLAMVTPVFVAAYAVKNKKPWARIASIIAAAMSIMNMPFGTLSGAHALWFFCGESWKEVYPQEPTAPKGLPQHQADANKWEEYTQSEDGEYVYRTPEMPNWR